MLYLRASIIALFMLRLILCDLIHNEQIAKRDVFVTEVKTVGMGLADFLDGLYDKTTQLAAPTTTSSIAWNGQSVHSSPVATSTPTSAKPGSGLKSLWSNLFGKHSSETQPNSVPATQSSSTTQSLITNNPSKTKAEGVDSFWSKLFGWGDNNGNSQTATEGQNTETPSTQETSNDFSLTQGYSSLGYSTSISSNSAPSTLSISESSSASSSYPTSSGGIPKAALYASRAEGITYSPYTVSGSCKSSSEVQADMEKLSGFGMIRLYSVDCNGIDNVLAALPSGAQVFLGVWNIDQQSLNSDLSTMKTAVENSSPGWDAVHTIAIGNERVNSGLSSVSEVVQAINYARQWLKSNASGFKGKVVTVDTLVAVMNNPSLCDASDYLTVNCHPYFSGSVLPSNAGSWLKSQISDLESKCNNGKEVFITETGWPTEGDTIGTCVPSLTNQVSAIQSITQSVGKQALMFTMYNDYWKNPGPYGVEQHWGIFGNPSA